MKYFVTGGTGFIGGEIIRQLTDAGHSVVALARSPEKAAKISSLPGVTIVMGDVTDKESMRGGVAGTDGVFHCAAYVKVGSTTAKDLEMFNKVNAGGTRNVLELVKELNVPKVVVTSSLAVNSDTKGAVVDELYEFKGTHISVYDESKWESHFKVAVPAIKEGTPVVIVMPGVVFGIDCPDDIEHFFVQFVKKQLPAVPDQAAYCWSTVSDVGKGHIIAMQKGKIGESYIIAGPPATFIEAMGIAEKITGIKAPTFHPSPALMRVVAAILTPISWFITLPTEMDPTMLRVIGATYLGSNAKAKRELGYDPCSIEDGMKPYLFYLMQKFGIPLPTSTT